MVNRFEQWLSKRGLLLALLATVFFARLLFYPILPSEKPGRELEVDKWGIIAYNLVQGHGYVSGTPPQPEAERGPVPVLWYAGVFLFFGQSLWAVVISNWLLDVGTAAVLFVLAQYLFPKKRAIAVMAVLMFAFYIPEISWSYVAMSEPIFTLLLMLHLLTLVYLLDQPSLSLAAMAGLWLGLGILARPLMLLFPVVILALMVFRYRQSRQIVISFGVLVLTCMTVLSPWIMRNYLTFGAFIPASNAFGYSLIQDHYYLTSPDYPQKLLSWDVSEVMAALLRERGDDPAKYDVVSLDKIYAREALARIIQRPDRYIEQSAYRFLRLWFNLGYSDGPPPSIRSWLVAGLHVMLLIMVALGFIWESRIRIRQVIPIWAIILFFTIVHVLILALVRYIFPVMPLVMLLAAPAIYRILMKFYTLWLPQAKLESNHV